MENKLAKLIALGEISLNELAEANALIEDAKLLKEALAVCKEKFLFHMGETKINCYSYEDSAGEYFCWGELEFDGSLTLYSNWGGNHKLGTVNINNESEVFLEIQRHYNDCDTMPVQLREFLNRQLK